MSLQADDGHDDTEEEGEKVQAPCTSSTEPNPTSAEELHPEQVRWFYKSTLKEKFWHPLNGQDSLAIEAAYRRHQVVLNKKDEGKTPEEGRKRARHWAATAVALGGLYGVVYDSGDSKSTKSQRTKSHTTRFPYRLKPLYWKESSLHLVRGTWFVDAGNGVWQPLDASSSRLTKQIEEQHLKMFGHQPIQPTPPPTPTPSPAPTAPSSKATNAMRVVCELMDEDEQKKACSGVRVCWYGQDDVRLFNYSGSSRLVRLIRTPAGAKLIRGYKWRARVDDGPPPVSDLILTVHGIGQKFKKVKKIVDKVSGIRDIGDELLRVYYPNLKARPLILPVDWRTDLQLDEDTIASLTPNFLEDIRSFFNNALLDLLYYASPVYGRKITESLSNALNRIYRTFITHDPDFNKRGGRISILAHSLGSVITYDIISVDRSNVDPPDRDDRISIGSRADIGTPQLMFQIRNLFCIGSPLSVFLATQDIRGPSILNPPSGDESFRMHNIYHPADVVAYRMEPLISETYANVGPLRIHRFDARDQIPYEQMPVEGGQPRTTKQQRGAAVVSPKNAHATTANVKGKSETLEISSSEALPYRVDYVLQVGRIVSVYLRVLTSHDQYWQDRDVIMYILTTLYGQPMPRNATARAGKNKKPSSK